jgi:myo-inositol-1(or 4)-monophosphatase
MQLSSGRLIACSPGLLEPLREGLAACRPLAGASYGAPELDGGEAN